MVLIGSDSSGLMPWIKSDGFLIIFYEMKYKTFFKNGSGTDSEMPRNSSDSLKLNSNAILSPRYIRPGANFGRLPELDHGATVGPTLAPKVC